jgi:two-component system, OmpR family, sensor histidine kinase KdpD
MIATLKRPRALAWGAMPLAVALITALGRWAGVNAPTICSFYLVVVLGLAAWGGWAVGVTASVAAMLCFNYFFLPPFGTLTIAEPANWVALIAFLVASTLASRLVATTRGQADEAQRRRREVETLYDLCFGLFTASQRSEVLSEAVARTLRAIGADSGGLLLGRAGHEEPLATVIGAGPLEIDRALAGRARERREVVEGREERGVRTAYIPLDVGGLLNGLLVARGPLASRAVLEPAGRLLALAIERERLLEEAARLAAVRTSDALKTSLLRAVSHDLRTPLTAMRLEIESLDRHLTDRPEALASLRGLSLEQERLARRIDDLLSLARLEAGVAKPHPEPVPPASLFRAARESLALILAGQPVEMRVDPLCPDVWTDPSLTLEILVNLLENAARATPPGQPIELAAGRDPGALERVRIEVRDRGSRRMDAVSGDSASGGLGLRIAWSFAEANAGTLALLDRPGGGTIAWLDLPAAPESAEEVAV